MDIAPMSFAHMGRRYTIFGSCCVHAYGITHSPNVWQRALIEEAHEENDIAHLRQVIDDIYLSEGYIVYDACCGQFLSCAELEDAENERRWQREHERALSRPSRYI